MALINAAQETNMNDVLFRRALVFSTHGLSGLGSLARVGAGRLQRLMDCCCRMTKA
jgi:hypothetical protein